MYKAQILIDVCCCMGSSYDVLHAEEPEEQNHHGTRCHVLHMGHIGAHRLDGASEVPV